jgi:hypothetical protein
LFRKIHGPQVPQTKEIMRSCRTQFEQIKDTRCEEISFVLEVVTYQENKATKIIGCVTVLATTTPHQEGMNGKGNQ